MPFVYLLFYFFFGSCNDVPKEVEKVLKLAGNNRKELEKVINHYQNPNDSLKLKAAYFLIENMDVKYSYDHNKIGPHKKLLSFIDSVHNAQKPVIRNSSKFWIGERVSKEGRTIVDNYWDTLKVKYGPFSVSSLPIVPDVEVIKADLLIENIDYAFRAWAKPWAKHLDFEQFCEYILPYRNLTEPLEKWRKEVYNTYSKHLKDISKNKGNTLEAAQKIYNEVAVVKNNYFTFREYPDLGWKDLNRVRMGTCRSQSNFIAYVMRSQGIPVSTVFLAHGTEWNVLIDSKGNYLQFGAEVYAPSLTFNYYLDVWKSPSTSASKFFEHSYKKDMRLLEALPVTDIPPFFRNPNLKDVTELLHNNSARIEIPLIKGLKHNDYLFLCDYNKESKWSAIDWSKIENGKANFPYVGSGKVYLPSLYSDDAYDYIQYPIYLEENGTQLTLKMDSSIKEKIRLYRKHPLGIDESKFAKKMINTYFQFANSADFSDAITIHKIKEKPVKAEEVKLLLDKKYRFLRYVSDAPINMAELAFFDKEDKVVRGELINSTKGSASNLQNAFDGDIKTYYENDSLSSWIGMKLKKPLQITKIKYLFRNSFNTIVPGHDYELFYWKGNSWVSLGRKNAQKDYLDYEAPKNAVLLLKDLTEGSDEMVFFIRGGKQIWG